MTTNFPEGALLYLEQKLCSDALKDIYIEEAKSAQQKVWILSLKTRPLVDRDSPLSQALESGRHCLVVRQWRGSARWWNLNSNEESAESLAKAEAEAYRIAYKALPNLNMPILIHFEAANPYPWAISSYVGERSTHFDANAYTTEWIEGMIKARPEFGFDEPHPRWGRVPVEQAIDYTLKVLRTVTIPLHKYIAINPDQSWENLTIHPNGRATAYYDMIVLYEGALSRMMKTLQDVAPNDEILHQLTKTLGKCVSKLREESVEALPAVLVHMDCQPQNLLFHHRDDNDTRISSVLDWEEAAYADPRFELLLLGRKVCANRLQADIIWQTYEKECQPPGPIEPWLRLETVHSITTLVLQSMNLLGGGRSPWETKPDLGGKIERELHRLIDLGWEFCQEAIQ
jgi:hypothetical protein